MDKQCVVDELHKPARRNYPRRKVEIRGLFDLWQADLVEMIPYANVNKGYKYLLTVIDACSKKAWAVAIKSKNGRDVTAGMAKVLKNAGRAPRHLQTDNGKEFYNTHFIALMSKHGINLYSTFSTKKASIVERFNRTIKAKMWKRFSLQGSYKWIDILDSLLDEYNTSVHRSIGMKPSDVTENDVERILVRLRHTSGRVKKPKFKLGNSVRLSKQKALFDKGYTPNWSAEIFKIVRIQPTNPVTYLLKDLNGNPIKGGFYEAELQKSRCPNVYLVEKVLRRKKDKVFVKWLGFDSTHNSWLNAKDIVTLKC